MRVPPGLTNVEDSEHRLMVSKLILMLCTLLLSVPLLFPKEWCKNSLVPMVALTCLQSVNLVSGILDSWRLCNSLRSDDKSLFGDLCGLTPRKPLFMAMKL